MSTPLSNCCGAAIETPLEGFPCCTACGQPCDEQRTSAVAGGMNLPNPFKCAKDIASYLVTGFHEATPEGRAAIARIVAAHIDRAVAEATAERDNADLFLSVARKDRDAEKQRSIALEHRMYGILEELEAREKEIAELKDLLRVARCPDCDGSGSYAKPMMSGDGEEMGVEQVQCRWCFAANAARQNGGKS